MPAPKTGYGPWGEAVNYWLPRCNMRAADLARTSGIDPKTISSIRRGFHTQTAMLQKIAEAFDEVAVTQKLGFRVLLQDVLISPARRMADEDLDRRIRENVAAAIRIDREQRTPSHVFMESLRADEEAARRAGGHRRPKPTHRSTKR